MSSTASVLQELLDVVRDCTRVQPRGHRTKSAPLANDATALDLTPLSGVIDYQPSEFIITAWAGTPIRDIQALLAGKGQYLPFDSLLAERGATVGGTVAANASGPERFRYGGVRDFIIGCRFIDGNGTLLSGGGKVVKNAAGFDYPKLFVGSLGTLGVLVDVTFKVFPAPQTYATLRVDCNTLAESLALLPKLTNSPYDINAIDIVTPHPNPLPQWERETALHIRVGGLAAGLAQRMERVRTLCGRGEVVMGADESALWHAAREFTWAEAADEVLKVPITPSQIETLDLALGNMKRRYSVGGNVAWIAAPHGHTLDATLQSQGLAGLILLNATGEPRIGKRSRNAFTDRAKQALDPHNKFIN